MTGACCGSVPFGSSVGSQGMLGGCFKPFFPALLLRCLCGVQMFREWCHHIPQMPA